ncbi:MAG: hypothetical protein KF816_02840 [Melioribacteraceae bacterium]|jgi:DNA replicative helicase MCM subunit Mcm2 (Cdc46/Mcm family)|nr:hypothetical protein [Melioribacteraceae bacterium]
MKKINQLHNKIALVGIGDSQAAINIVQFQKNSSTNKINEYEFVSVSELKSEQFVTKPIKLVVTLTQISEPKPVDLEVENENIRVSVVELGFTDLRGDNISSFNISLERYHQLFKRKKLQKPFILFGTVISIYQENFSGYLFYIENVKENLNQMDLMQMSESEAKSIKNFLTSKRPKIDCRSYIKNELKDIFGIRGLEKATELDKAIDFTIIQALSYGMSAGSVYSNKLHSLLIGAPASGKKLISMCALLLSPNEKHVSSTLSKITPAGLIGNASRSGGNYVSKPGLIPSANHGIVCFEDFHEVTKRQNEISSILSMVMEDGKVEDSTSAKTTHESCTSIHIDMNRQSQVNPNGNYNSHTDLNIPMNIISRFDSIIEIPVNVERQMEVTYQMIGRNNHLESTQLDSIENPRRRKLQSIVAYVNTHYSSINYPKKVQDYLKKKLQNLFSKNEDYLHLTKHFAGMLTRMLNSIEKMAKAICASKLKDTLSTGDIDEAFTFINYKLEFLSNFDVVVGLDEKKDNPSKKDQRKSIITEEFSGKNFTIKEVKDFVIPKSGMVIDGRTIKRDIDEMIASDQIVKVKHNKYQFK